MKHLIFAIAAAFSINAFAQKSMVTLEGYETGDETDRSLNFSNSTGGSSNDKETNIALNYAYAITDSIQVGFKYTSHNATSGGEIAAPGDKYVGYGVVAIYNFAGKLTDTNYFSVGYGMIKSEKSDALYDTDEDGNEDSKLNDSIDVTAWNFEFGHRFSIGNLGGMNFNYSPSVNLAFQNTEFDISSDMKSSNTNLTLNFVKFDVLF